MPIGWKYGWLLIGLALSLTTGCDAICGTCAASDKGIAASNNEIQGPTVEIRGHSGNTTVTPKAIDAHVALGTVIVSVVEPGDANHVVILAKNVMLADNLAERNLIIDTVTFAGTPDQIESVEVAPGPGTPDLETHIYVQQGVPLKIVADNGSIQISGHVGAVTANASGKDHGITVDGAHTHLTLHADNGPIQITAQKVRVDASTGAGDILFVGELQSGTNYFTTTSASNITVIMPRYDMYTFTATTSVNTIDVQYPAITEGRGTPVCATFDSGPPYVIRVDDHDHHERGQMTINKGDVRSGAAAKVIGIITPYYLAIHSTARNVLLEAPNISEFYPETRSAGVPTVTPIQLATATLQPSPEPSPQAPPATPQLSPTEQAMIASFQGMAIPAAQPLGESPGSNTPIASASVAIGGEIMYSVHCPIEAKRRITPQVAIVATSGGGHIRIYQNLP